MKPLQTVLDNMKIYDFVKLDKDRVMIITMQAGVRVLVVDLKRRAQYELKWWADTQKVRVLPCFDLKLRPLVLTVRHDQLTLRNLQNHTIVTKLRDNDLPTVEGVLESMWQDSRGVCLLRQGDYRGTRGTQSLVVQRINTDYEYIVKYGLDE